MDLLLQLWLPIVLSAVAVFILSALMWMAMPHHKGDLHSFPNEESVVPTIRSMNLAPGQYMYPHCDSNAEMKSEEFKRKMEEGPFFTLTMWKGKPNMARNMGLTFLFFLIVTTLIGYLSSVALVEGENWLPVFRFVTITGLLAFAAGGIPHAIWFGRPLRAVVTDTVDNVIYAVATGAIFAWLWPTLEAVNGLPAPVTG